MRLVIDRAEGLRNDLLLTIARDEIDATLLSVVNRDRLLRLPGIPRHRDATPDEARAFAEAKQPIDAHLRALGVIDAQGRAVRRAVAVSNRNLGANHGALAWQRNETPRVFRVLEDPGDYAAYSCLTCWRDGTLSIEDLRFDIEAGRVADAHDGLDLSDDLEWATFGQRVLRDRAITRVDDIIDQFYDVRHVFAFDPRREEGEAVRRAIYDGYPRTFREHVRRAWQSGTPRARYVHNAIGLSSEAVIIVQREGTIEEVAAALVAAGANDGVILDNGGSVACWAWWVNDYAGGLISPTVDFRPPGTSAIAFVLKGPLKIDLPGGSVSYSAY